MTRPVPLIAVLVLFINDHWLKHAWPGWITGKLSDVAGMIFFPILLHTLLWTTVPRRLRADARSHRLLIATCVATVVVFALVKTVPFATELYRVTWGALAWPVRAARALLGGRSVPGYTTVHLVRDPSDLLALPFVLVAYASARHGTAFRPCVPTRAASPKS